jgi:raffinose/stachyose/melibiose transport system permease protein
MLFVVAISLAPLLWVAVSSLKTNAEILNSAFSVPARPSLAGYIHAIRISHFGQFFANSTIISACAVLIGLLIYSMAGYVLARFDFRGKTLVLLGVGFTLLIPGYSFIQPIFRMVSAAGLYNTRIALVIVYITGGMAASVYIMVSGFKSIPKEMEESAYIDGASFPQIFWMIAFPLVRASMVSTLILRFLGHWNEFLWAFLLTSSTSKRTVPVALRYFNLQFSYNYPAMFAALIMAIVPSILIYLVFMETISKSVTSGALKG